MPIGAGAALLGSAGLATGTNIGGAFLQHGWDRQAADEDWAHYIVANQNRIRWAVDDAKRAGIHPLYALGAPSIAPPPQTIGQANIQGAMREAGQDISRLLDPMTKLALERGRIDNFKASNEAQITDMERRYMQFFMENTLKQMDSPDQGTFGYPGLEGINLGRHSAGGIGLPGASGFGADPTGKVGANEPLQADRLWNVRGVPVFAPIPVAMDFFTWWDNASNRARMGVIELNKRIRGPEWEGKFLEALYGKAGAKGGPLAPQPWPFPPLYK